jgi:hypothetical protein
MTGTIHSRLSRLERSFLPPERDFICVHLVATDEEEATAWQAIQVDDIDPADNRIRIIRLVPPEHAYDIAG